MKRLKIMGAVAGLSLMLAAGQANAAALISVTEAYNADATDPPVGDFLTFTNISGVSIYNVSVTGGVGGDSASVFRIRNGSTLTDYFLGDLIGPPGTEGTATITFNLGSATGTLEKISFTDILGVKPGQTGSAPIAVPASAVPEPASWLMMLLGFGMLGAVVRSKAVRKGKAQPATA